MAPTRPLRCSRRPIAPSMRLLALLWLAISTQACSSEHRGDWSGTFEGTVSGTLELTINARGTTCQGTMTGATSDGQPFTIEFEGILRQDYLSTELKGRAGLEAGNLARGAGALPLSFRGSMTGFLSADEGHGEWQAELNLNSYPMSGTWTLYQHGQAEPNDS